ncbi:MAG: TfoX/Sxy family protein [Thiobacillus sp.]|nr:TfoX/Sxy family protein [Thiobacillus sp.]
MAYDKGVAERLRELFADHSGVTEKKMFGGMAFMVRGHMLVGIIGESLMARVGPDDYAAALSRTFVREMDFTGKPMKGYVYVAPAGYESDADLQSWVDRCLDYNKSLSAK